jgi:hypothetical protein
VSAVVLPPLEQHPSPNRSPRRAGVVPYVIVVHRPVGGYASALRALTDPAPGGDRDAAVSAHILTDSSRRAAQLVPWDRKAWAAEAFNSQGYHIETDDDAWNGRDPAALATAARIVAYLCTRTGIPPVWTRDPANLPGVCRHYDLGRAGGGHTDPTTDVALWTRFVRMVVDEFKRGGFRPSWGTGHLARIDT